MNLYISWQSRKVGKFGTLYRNCTVLKAFSPFNEGGKGMDILISSDPREAGYFQWSCYNAGGTGKLPPDWENK